MTISTVTKILKKTKIKIILLTYLIFVVFFPLIVLGQSPSPEFEKLIEGISQIGAPGSNPCSIKVLSNNPEKIAFGDEDSFSCYHYNYYHKGEFPPVAVASTYGKGRIIAVGHECYFSIQHINKLDNLQFGLNIINWLDHNKTNKILFDGRPLKYYWGSNVYKGLMQELINRRYNVDVLNSEVTSNILSNYGIYVIAISWDSFSSSEISAIKDFVNTGGGLFLIGVGWSWVDYHPKSTLNEYPMNIIAQNFGIKFLDDVICDPTNNYGDQGWPIFHLFYSATAKKIIKSLFVPNIGIRGYKHLIKVSAQNVGSYSESDEISVMFPSYGGGKADLSFEWILSTNRKGKVTIWSFLDTHMAPLLQYDINPLNSLYPQYWRSKQMSDGGTFNGKHIWKVTLDENFKNGDRLYLRVKDNMLREYEFNPFYITGVNTEEQEEHNPTDYEPSIIDSEGGKLKVFNWDKHQIITFVMGVIPHELGLESIRVQCSSAEQEASCPIFPQTGVEPDSQGRCPTEVLLGNDNMACGFSQEGRQVSLFYPQKGAWPQLPYVTDAGNGAQKPFLGAREWEGMFAGIRRKDEILTEGQWEFSWLHGSEWHISKISQPLSGENVGGMELKYDRYDETLSVSESSFVMDNSDSLIRSFTITNTFSTAQNVRFIYYAFPNLGRIPQSPFLRVNYLDLFSGWLFQDNRFESLKTKDGSHILIWSDSSKSIYYAMTVKGPEGTSEYKAQYGYVGTIGLGANFQYLTDGVFSSIQGDLNYLGWSDTKRYNAYIEWDLGTLEPGASVNIEVYETCSNNRDNVINLIKELISKDVSILKARASQSWADFFDSIPAINDLSEQMNKERLELLKRCFLVLRLCRDKSSGAMVASPQLCPKYYGTWPRDATFQAAAWLIAGLAPEAEGLWSWLFNWDEDWPPLRFSDNYRGFNIVLHDIAGFERRDNQRYWAQCYACDHEYVGLPWPDFPGVSECLNNCLPYEEPIRTTCMLNCITDINVQAIVEEDQMGIILWGIWLFYKKRGELPERVDMEKIDKVASYLIDRICEDAHNESPKKGLLLPSLDIAESPIKFYPKGKEITDIGQSLWTNSAVVAGLRGAAAIYLAEAEKLPPSTLRNRYLVKVNQYTKKANEIKDAIIKYLWYEKGETGYFRSRWLYFFKESKLEGWEIPIGFADTTQWHSFLLEDARDDAFFSVPFGLTLPNDNKTEKHLNVLKKGKEEAIFTASYMCNALVYLQCDKQCDKKDKAKEIVNNVLNNLTKAKYVPENFYESIPGLYGASKPLGWAHAMVALAIMAEADKKYNLPLPKKLEIVELTPDIKANDSDGPIIVGQSDPLSITVSLDNNDITDNADWWLAADTPSGLYFFTFNGWTTDWVPGYQGPLFYLDLLELLHGTPAEILPMNTPGTYTFYFGVDTVMDGDVTWDSLYYDNVVVNVTE